MSNPNFFKRATNSFLGIERTEKRENPKSFGQEIPESFALDKEMEKIHKQGNLIDVVKLMQKVEKIIPKYKNSPLYKLILPGPYRLVMAIQSLFYSKETTAPLFDFLVTDWSEINWSLRLYIFVLAILVIELIFGAVLVFTFLTTWVFITNKFFWAWFIFLGLVYGIFLRLQIMFFNHTIENIVFVRIYEGIYQSFENRQKEQQKLINTIYSMPDKIQEWELASAGNKILASLQSEEKRHLKELELKRIQGLQDLAAIVAKHQATSDAEIQEIQSKTRLDILERELGIRNQEEAKKRSHEVLLKIIEAESRVLVAQSEALARILAEKAKYDSEQLKTETKANARVDVAGAEALGHIFTEKAKAEAATAQDRQKIQDQKDFLDYQIKLRTQMKSRVQSKRSGVWEDESFHETCNSYWDLNEKQNDPKNAESKPNNSGQNKPNAESKPNNSGQNKPDAESNQNPSSSAQEPPYDLN
jgi:hypothetical protein